MGFSAMSSFLPVNTGVAAVDPVEHGKDVPAPPLPPQPHPEVKTEPQIQEQKLPITASVSTEGNRRPIDGILNPPQMQSNPNDTAASGENTASREGSSTQSSAHDEVAAAESDGDHHYHSDNEAGVENPAPPSKRKKGQRFFCKGYPPCNLSFTRSEHLARHIRKHTGERPFQCHCSRRFSRLDNLRQHAQTVHVNEDIPGDSLAATGTRFQRQVRTDRVRQPGRARAGTTGSGSQTAHSRAHSRNLSTSSVTSNISSYGQSPETRRRPPPLMMANDGTARARMSLEAMTSPPNTPPGQTPGFLGHSPGVPLYTGYSAGGPGDMGSPYYASPASTTSVFWPDRMAARRLSVPSGQRPFDPHGATYPPGYARQPMPTPVRYSGNGNSFASPTTGSQTPADTPGLSPSEADLRRRTWHPSTYSGFPRPVRDSWPQQPAHRLHPEFPAVVPPSDTPSRNQTTRLPGIESFDQYPLVPPPRQPTPMLVDRGPEVRTSASTSTATPAFAPSFSSQTPTQRPLPPFTGAGHRRGNLSIDTTLQRTLTNLDIHGTNSQRDATQWGQQTLGELQNIGSRPSTSSTYSQASNRQETIPGDQPSGHPQSQSREFAQHWNNRVSADRPQNPTSLPFAHPENPGNDGINNSMEYHPDVTQGRTSSDGSQNSNVPSSTADATQNSGLPPTATSNTNPGYYSGAANNDTGMDRLEALVAVATSEDKDKFR